MKYLCLLRGINVGGKNTVSMKELVTHLEEAGFTNVLTYINSGNVLLDTTLKSERAVEEQIEKLLPTKFKLDSELIKIRAVSKADLEKIVSKKPKGFADPKLYHSDVLFPMQIPTSDIMAVCQLNPDVDAVWEANGVVYFRRLSSMRTKSRLNRIIATPTYKSVTIRSWNTTLKLLDMFDK